MRLPDPGLLFAAAISIYRHVFEASSTSVVLNLKWLSKYATLDPRGGNGTTENDVAEMNSFAYAELEAISLAGESAASTGFPLTDTERRRKKEADQKDKEAKKVSKAANESRKGVQKGGDSGTRPTHVDGGGGKGDKKIYQQLDLYMGASMHLLESRRVLARMQL